MVQDHKAKEDAIRDYTSRKVELVRAESKIKTTAGNTLPGESCHYPHAHHHHKTAAAAAGAASPRKDADNASCGSSNSSSSFGGGSYSAFKETKPRRWSQVLALLPVYLLQISYGMNTGYPAIVTPQLEEPCSEFKVSLDEESWIVSLDNFATPLVCILSGFLQQYFGPLKVLVFACFPYTAGWIVAATADSAHYLYFSRILVGVSNALLTTTVYTVEIASKDMRGTYSLLESVLRCFGCLLIYCLGYVMRWKTIAMFGPVIPVSAFVACLTVAHESPVFLIGREKIEKAKKTLRKLYGPEYRVDEEVEIIRLNLKERKRNLAAGNGGKSGSTWSYLARLKNNPEVYKPFSIVLFLIAMQQFSGMSILRAYVVKIFNDVFSKEDGGNGTDDAVNRTFLLTTATPATPDCSNGPGGTTSSEAYLSAIIIGFVRLIASLLLSKLLRIYRRRAMYFLSAFATIASLFSFAACNLMIGNYASTGNVVLETSFKWASLVTACLLVFSVQLGIQTLPFLLSGELFPSDIRAFCKGLTRSFACLLLVANLKLYPYLGSHLGIGGTFSMFGGVLLLSVPVVYFILPETKDLGLEMIQEYFMPQRTIFYVDTQQQQQLSAAVSCSSCSACDECCSSCSSNSSNDTTDFPEDYTPTTTTTTTAPPVWKAI